MKDHLLGYREVIPDQTIPEKWKEITLNTGGTQSTLQDIKMPERAGGYCYKDTSKPYLVNRFIYWHSRNDILELVEVGLDMNLSGNQLRLGFTNSPLLDGISVYESQGTLVLLVATVSSVHRISFTHPDVIHRQKSRVFSHTESIFPSVFSDVMFSHVCHVLSHSNTSLPHTAATWLIPNGSRAIYAVGYNSGPVNCIFMEHPSEAVTTVEIKHDSLPRFLSNLTGALRGRSAETHACISMVVHSIDDEPYLFGHCRDGKLRMWSLTHGHLITSANVIGDLADGTTQMQGAQGHMLRKGIDDSGSLVLCLFLRFTPESQFVFVRPTYDSQSLNFTRVSVLYAPQQDIIDFAISHSNIWALWSSAEGEASVSSALIHCESVLGLTWLPATLESGLERDIANMEPNTDPRQAYCSFIFHPGQFQLSVISRALNIFRRSSSLSDNNISAASLRDRVCIAVEAEIQSEAQECEINDDEYLEISYRCWARFYSCCLQYHVAGSEPVGLVVLESTGGVALVRKALVSLIRPVDLLEHLVLYGAQTTTQHFSNVPQLACQESICEDLMHLMSALVLLEHRLSEEVKCDIEKQLYQLNLPDIMMLALLPQLKSGGEEAMLSPDFLNKLWGHVEQIGDIYKVIHLLLDILRMDEEDGGDDLIPMKEEIKVESQLAIGRLYGSRFGLSTIAESLRQVSAVRFSVCRNLLLLQHIILDEERYSENTLQSVRSECSPQTVIFLQAYYVIMWLCETPVKPTLPANVLESSMLRLSSLQLTDKQRYSVPQTSRNVSLLELFLQGVGAHHVQVMLDERHLDEGKIPQWHHSMLLYVKLLGQLVWAVRGNFVFGEWLVSSGQHLLLHEYVRLLRSWCIWNSCSRQFILAVSLLDTGEPHKALDLFLSAALGVNKEEFLKSKIIPNGSISSARDNVLYLAKVIKLFQEHSAPDCIIELAENAVSVAEPDDRDIPMFQFIIFQTHLELEHYEQAYHALSRNPDNVRRRESLRLLIGSLFNKKRLDMLLAFPYVDLYADFQNFVEQWARNSDIMTTQYYNFLYSFYIHKENMRKAGTVMFEQAFRLGIEGNDSVECLTKQSHSLLAALNALTLIEPKYAWLVQPINPMEKTGTTSKRDVHGDFVPQNRKQVKVIEIVDIRKELELVNARIKIAKHNYKLQSIIDAGPQEIVSILSSLGLYTTAISLCITCNVTLTIPFESLANACVRLAQNESSDAWNWLVQNNLSDLGIVETHAGEVVWRLLQVLLEKFEEKGHTVLYKAVTKRLLSLDVFLPNWLMASYKCLNCAELLRLLTSSGRLLEAADLCKDLILASLGPGCELFGLEPPLRPNAPALCLPITTIDVLLNELSQLRNNEQYNQCYRQLNEVVEHYIKQIMRISEVMEQAHVSAMQPNYNKPMVA